MNKKIDYQNTLNLPRTDFPMKANLLQQEPQRLNFWEKIDIYTLIRKQSLGKPKYVLHDGPPYANGDIHLGHVLNKVLKDIIIKYRSMQGFDAHFIPGWDCHGLPVEYQLFKELGINKYQISQIEFRKKAHAYALKYVDIQRREFKRLGVFGDWKHPYLTLNPEYEAEILRALAQLVKGGYIYQGLKPVNWCYICETALAEAEVEYEDKVSNSIYIKFKLDENNFLPSPTFLVIWTTTPWTLLANVAAAVNPEFAYVAIKTSEGNFVVLKELVYKIAKDCGIERFEIIKEFLGKDLEGLTYQHPFIERKGKVVLADYVSKDEGTGIVHTAPGHGNEDYLTGLKYQLPIIMPVDSKGNFDKTCLEFSGLNVHQAEELIIKKLKDQKALLLHLPIKHSYPYCWRCKNPLIFRATKQWFLNLEHQNLRERLLDFIYSDKISWIPPAGKERIYNMVKLRPDWCLSRQRYWGVPIPSLVCNSCKEEILDYRVIEKLASFVEKEGSDCWFSRKVEDFLPEDFYCLKCKKNNFSKGQDIVDVWFESGVSHQALLKKKKDLAFPADLYLEGSDQHRGWFQSSLIPAVCIDHQAPFKAVLTHGFVVDAQGMKMSKSLGNVISPFDIIKDFGAEILRLWVASNNYHQDIRVSLNILEDLSQAYRKIRNTIRFILSNLFDFNPDTDKIDYRSLRKIDKLYLYRLEERLTTITQAYEEFEFYKAYKQIYDFCNEDLSMQYLDMIKGRLYTYPSRSHERRAAQTVIYEIINVLVRVIAPIFVFTAEEVWQYMPKEEGESNVQSVHLLEWPKVNPVFAQSDLDKSKNIQEELSGVLELIPVVAKKLEEARNRDIIGSSFDAKIILLTNQKEYLLYLEGLKEELAEIFRVSQIEVKEGKLNDGKVEISVEKAEGKKCMRCWNYSLDIDKNPDYPGICERCVKKLGG